MLKGRVIKLYNYTRSGIWFFWSCIFRFRDKLRFQLIHFSFILNMRIKAHLRHKKSVLYQTTLFHVSNLALQLFVPSTMLAKYDVQGKNLRMLGKHKAALENGKSRERKRQELLIKRGMYDKKLLLLPDNFAKIIGLMGNLDHIVKRKILENDKRQYYLLAPKENIINYEYLKYWEQYITIVSNEDEVNELKKYGQLLYVPWDSIVVDLEKDTAFTATTGNSFTEEKWIEQGRDPLLKLDSAHIDLLERSKQLWGLGNHNWFVCLHVRSGGFHKEDDGATQAFRNTSIQNYYALINAVTERGGWVFRMGDPSMEPLDMSAFTNPSMVIDYAHSKQRCSGLDIALVAKCHLFLSTSSGLHSVAKSFGVPALAINAPVYRGFPYFHNTMFLPPFYYSYKKKRVLTMHEILSSDILYSNHQCHFDRQKLCLKYVPSEDMVAALDEALAMAAGNTIKLEGAASIFNELNKKYQAAMNGFIGDRFAKKYAKELGLQ
jgi:putative glycosyltransferase (TIGR04372 family)